jgi:uncharacterized protein (UPF0332 family)
MNDEVAQRMQLAQEMFREGEMSEANGFPRGAADGAYLAMEHPARAMLLTRGLRLRKHQAVISEFGRLFARSGAVDAKFHRYLIDDFVFRNLAEYDPIPEPPLTLGRTTRILEHAAEFIAMAEKFLEGTGGNFE